MTVLTSVLFLSICCAVFSLSPTRKPSFNTPKCPLSGSISCSINGRGCNEFSINLNEQCTTTFITRYNFTYCNLNAFPVQINATLSSMRSEFVMYGFPNMTVSSSACVSVIRKGFLNNCNRTSSASLRITAKASTGPRCYVYTQLLVAPKIITSAPTKAPVKLPPLTIRPTKLTRKTRAPSKKPTSMPIKVPTGKPVQKHSSSPSIYTTVRPSKAPTKKPITKPTLLPTLAPSGRPSKQPTLSPFRNTSIPTRKPTRKPSGEPSKKPSRNPTGMPSKKPTNKPTNKPLTPTRKPSAVKGPTNKPMSNPTIPPTASICGTTPWARSISLTNIVIGLSSATSQALTNSSSPQSLALSWLINQDGLKLCPGDSRIVQRFTMAVFYFSTGGDSWIGCGRNALKACNPSLTFVIGDPLVARYGNLTWLSSVDECLWGGLACNNTDGTLDRIEFNRVTANKLQGSLPVEVTLLTNMRYLIIESCCSSSIPSYNASGFAALQGKLPSTIGNLVGLRVLDLSYNLMTGTIPTSILNIPKLKEIDLNFNNFIGTFPSPQNATQLSKLLYVHLESNAFTGTVPNIGNAVGLANFTLQANQFAGQMPQAICNLITPPPGGVKVLNDLWSDCLGTPAAPAKVICPCCTKCF